MDLRRLASVTFAYLIRRLETDERVEEFRAELREPFAGELDERERKRLEYRRRAREIGAVQGAASLMAAFDTAAAG